MQKTREGLDYSQGELLGEKGTTLKRKIKGTIQTGKKKGPISAGT